MKKVVLLLLLSIMTIGSQFAFAGFPVTNEPQNIEVVSVVESPIVEPVSSGSLNWQAIVSVSCLLLGFSVSWFLLIPGLVFGIMGVIGDKNMKWLGWIGMISNAVWLVLMLAIIGSM